MVERLRSLKISVEVDTNKATYEKEFDDVDEMLEWLEMLEVGDFRPTNTKGFKPRLDWIWKEDENWRLNEQ